jgi:hypothetical protein
MFKSFGLNFIYLIMISGVLATCILFHFFLKKFLQQSNRQ